MGILSDKGDPAGFVTRTRSVTGPSNLNALSTDVLRDTMQGKYLAGGPGFKQMAQSAAYDIMPQVQSAFAGANRLAGSQLAPEMATDAMARRLAPYLDSERNRMLQAPEVARAIQTNEMQSDPYFENKLANILGAGSLLGSLFGGGGGGILGGLGSLIGGVGKGIGGLFGGGGDTGGGGLGSLVTGNPSGLSNAAMNFAQGNPISGLFDLNGSPIGNALLGAGGVLGNTVTASLGGAGTPVAGLSGFGAPGGGGLFSGGGLGSGGIANQMATGMSAGDAGGGFGGLGSMFGGAGPIGTGLILGGGALAAMAAMRMMGNSPHAPKDVGFPVFITPGFSGNQFAGATKAGKYGAVTTTVPVDPDKSGANIQAYKALAKTQEASLNKLGLSLKSIPPGTSILKLPVAVQRALVPQFAQSGMSDYRAWADQQFAKTKERVSLGRDYGRSGAGR